MSQFIDNNDYGASTLRYPLQPPVMDQDFNGDSADSLTGRIDYLRIRRKKTVFNDGTKTYYGGNNFPRNTAQTDHHRTMCYLAIPNGVSTQYTPQYNQVNLGVGGSAAIAALGSGGADKFNALAGSLRDAAGSVFPEFAANAIVQGANAISNFLGVSSNLDANSLEGLTSGRVFNPYMEQIFKQMNFRTHSFSFKMFARNVKEAREIKKIIQYIKIGAHPKVSGVDQEISEGIMSLFSTDDDGDDDNVEGAQGVSNFLSNNTLGANRFFGVPDQYELAFMRMNPKSGEFDSVTQGIPYANPSNVDQSLTLHYKMNACVCSGFSIDYTPDGQYTSLKRIDGNMIQVPAVIMQLNFTEVRLLNQADARSGF